MSNQQYLSFGWKFCPGNLCPITWTDLPEANVGWFLPGTNVGCFLFDRLMRSRLCERRIRSISEADSVGLIRPLTTFCPIISSSQPDNNVPYLLSNRMVQSTWCDWCLLSFRLAYSVDSLRLWDPFWPTDWSSRPDATVGQAYIIPHKITKTCICRSMDRPRYA